MIKFFKKLPKIIKKPNIILYRIIDRLHLKIIYFLIYLRFVSYEKVLYKIFFYRNKKKFHKLLKNYIYTVMKVRRDIDFYCDKNDFLIELLKTISINKLSKKSADNLLYLSRCMYGIGFFRFSYIIRMLSIQQLTLDKKRIKDLPSTVIIELTLLSTDDVAGLKQYTFFQQSFFNLIIQIKDSTPNILNLINLISLNHRTLEQKNLSYISKENLNFFLVGPSMRSTDKKPIGTNNKIVRIGYHGQNDSTSLNSYATNVSFYKNFKLASLQSNQIKTIFSELEIIIVSNLSKETSSKIYDKSNLVNSCCANPIIYGGDELNGGVECILNLLLLFEGSKVTVTNMDLFMNKKYPLGYTVNGYNTKVKGDGWSMSDEDICWANAVNHSQAFQFNLLKNLWMKNYIYPDGFLEFVLNRSIISYFSELEKLYNPLKDLRSEL